MSKFAEIKAKVQSRPMAMSPTSIHPDQIPVDIYGHFASYCFRGYRVWGFAELSGRDLFVKNFAAQGAEKVPA